MEPIYNYQVGNITKEADLSILEAKGRQMDECMDSGIDGYTN